MEPIARKGKYAVFAYGSEYRVLHYLTENDGQRDPLDAWKAHFDAEAGMYLIPPRELPEDVREWGRDEARRNPVSRMVSGERAESNISRARSRIFELAACNQWDWFCTFTLSDKWDRTDLREWRRSFSQWLRDERKLPGQGELRYLLIPEQHKDGAWHMHGLVSGLSGVSVRDYAPEDIGSLQTATDVQMYKAAELNRKGYKNWERCARKYGYVSLSQVREPLAVSRYITKYISKSLSLPVLAAGSHLFYASQGLRGRKLLGIGYGEGVSVNAPSDATAAEQRYFCNEYLETWWCTRAEQLPLLSDAQTGEVIELSL